MVLEFAQHGELYQWYRSTSYRLPQALTFALHISKAVARGYIQVADRFAQITFPTHASFLPTTDMHSFPAPIIHRDLKSLNVLVAEGTDGVLVAKVSLSLLCVCDDSKDKEESSFLLPRLLTAVRAEG